MQGDILFGQIRKYGVGYRIVEGQPLLARGQDVRVSVPWALAPNPVRKFRPVTPFEGNLTEDLLLLKCILPVEPGSVSAFLPWQAHPVRVAWRRRLLGLGKGAIMGRRDGGRRRGAWSGSHVGADATDTWLMRSIWEVEDMVPTSIKRHVLPGEEGGETAWFYKQNAFEQQEIFRQVAFKRRHWPQLNDGRSSQHPTYTYPHILPKGLIRLAFHDPIADSILSYLAKRISHCIPRH